MDSSVEAKAVADLAGHPPAAAPLVATEGGPVAKLIESASDLLAGLDHCKDGYYRFDDEGNLTAVDVQGALLESAPKGWRRQLVWEGAIPFLREAIGSQEIASWNDEPGRTKDDVLAALNRAAEKARSNGR